MILRCSRFIHQLPVGKDRILIIHAIRHMRLPADKDVNALLNYFSEPRRVPEDCEILTTLIPFTRDQIAKAIAGLFERQILTDKTPDEEEALLSNELSPTHGRDPGEILERYRRELKEGSAPYWSVGSSYNMKDLGSASKRVDVLLLGDCDIQMEADFLRQEASRHGIDLRVSATFPGDVRFASEHKHDAIFIGALRGRHLITEEPSPEKSTHAGYIAEARHLLTELRKRSPAPILLDNLPEPTVQPLGMAEHGLMGHRTRFRAANIALAELAASFSGVYILDIAAALSAIGSEPMLDDGQVGFTHFGSPGWMLQRPESEKAAVHGIFPNTKPLAEFVGGNPYGREAAMAVPHINALVTVLGIGRKKCVILDLDGTLWPGVLAETGSPFAWTPEISGTFSYIGLYFGLHEALLSLKKRGILLAAVSKNDEATVKELWKYPDHYPNKRLLKPEDFVTWRINWNDKVDNINSIADELGFALDTFLFIDDHPVERDRVRKRIPDVEVWGEDVFGLRRRLLNDPRLQLPVITEEAAQRSTLVKAQIERQHLRAETTDENQYLETLQIRCQMERLAPDASQLARVEELFQRTTQFNATCRKFTASELASLTNNPKAHIYVTHVSDRFGDYGLVGAAVILNNEIIGLAVSCRALGMGVEHQFIKYILGEHTKTSKELRGFIIETPRNIPVRHIYGDNGFKESSPGTWETLL